jgi:hypothetical protein
VLRIVRKALRWIEGMSVSGDEKVERNAPNDAGEAVATRECSGGESPQRAGVERVDRMMKKQ